MCKYTSFLHISFIYCTMTIPMGKVFPSVQSKGTGVGLPLKLPNAEPLDAWVGPRCIQCDPPTVWNGPMELGVHMIRVHQTHSCVPCSLQFGSYREARVHAKDVHGVSLELEGGRRESSSGDQPRTSGNRSSPSPLPSSQSRWWRSPLSSRKTLWNWQLT